MDLTHRFPFAENRCIVSKYQTCRFSENPLKNVKSVFIAAPAALRDLTDIVKGIVEDYDYEPIIAVDLTEYNNSAFCAHICRPMLESLVVIVIGDWKQNQGNVNVAFEHGIATSMGCEIVPVWISSDEKDPFDISGLSAILIKEDWETNSKSLSEFKTKFQKYFETKSDALISEINEPMIPDEAKTQIRELTARFQATLDKEERQAIVSTLQRLGHTYYETYRDDAFVKWITLTTVIYAQSFIPELEIRIGRSKYELDERFLELLKKTVENNSYRLQSDVVTNSDFHRALSNLVIMDDLPMPIRMYSLECIVALGSAVGNDELLWVIRTIASDTRIEEKDYSSLNLGQNLSEFIGRALGSGPSLLPAFEMIAELRRSPESVVKKRGDELLKAVIR